MKATLEFNLPEDEVEFYRVNKSLHMACALFDILQLRKKCCNRLDSIDDETINAYEGVGMMSEAIAEILEKYAINIDKLIE